MALSQLLPDSQEIPIVDAIITDTLTLAWMATASTPLIPGPVLASVLLSPL
jgi:hypothetical protein